MSDSGKFGPAMKNVPNSLHKPTKRKVNPNVKKQLTGKIMLTQAMKPFGK